MAIIYKDFTYMGKSLKDMGLMSVDFDEKLNIPMGLQRTITKGETNRYRVKSNHIYTTYNNPLEFELHIIKDEAKCGYVQSKMKFSREEIRQVTRWLSSTTIPQLLITTDNNGDTLNYCGIFTNIESFVVGGDIYGFILSFTNDSPFAYSDSIDQKLTLNGLVKTSILNNSDLLDDYLYPIIHIEPKSNTDFYMCNLSDCTVLDTGKIAIGTNISTTTNNFLNKLNTFATENRYKIEFYYGDNKDIKLLGNNTAVRIKLIENDNTEHFCFAYYESNGSYKIIEGGFLTLKLYSDLDVDVNCELLTIQDSIGRMVHFKNIGLEEEDYIYWLRFISGDNALLFYGTDCTIEIEYREMIKVGAA